MEAARSPVYRVEIEPYEDIVELADFN